MPKIKLLTVLSLSLLLSSCKPTREFPVDYIYMTDIQHMVCSQFQIVDKEKFTFKRVQDVPLVSGGPCDGLAGFHRADYPKVRTWIQWEIQNQETCN